MITEPNRRFELKISLEPHQLSQARSWLWLNPAGFRTAYPPRFVNSLYFDTPELANLNDNLAGTSLRQKIRLRWYDDLTDELNSPILELKYKKNRMGGKKRLELPLTLNLSERWALILRTLLAQVPAEWQAYLATNTQPTLIVRYRREYYATADGRIRATLDSDQQAFSQRLTVRPNRDRPLNLANHPVIELKAGLSEEARLQDITANLPLTHSRNSKYVNGTLAEW
jgi:hypothetical protein